MSLIKGNRVVPYAELEQVTEQVTRVELYAMGVNIIRNYLVPKSPKDTEAYITGHKLRFTGRGFNVKMLFVNNVAYATYIEGGRTPGKRPPLHAILGWVRRHAIGEVYNIRTRELRQGYSSRRRQFLSGKDFLEQAQVRAAKKIAARIGMFGQPGRWLYRDLETANASVIAATTGRIREQVIARLN